MADGVVDQIANEATHLIGVQRIVENDANIDNAVSSPEEPGEQSGDEPNPDESI